MKRNNKANAVETPPKFNAKGQIAAGNKKVKAAEKENKEIRALSDPPKKPCSSYIFFSNEFIEKNKATANVSHKDLMKLAGQKWSTITEAEKNKYIKMNESDKIRYQKEQVEFDRLGYFTYLSGPNQGSKSSEFLMSAKYFAKDIVMPKKPLGSYMCFVKVNSAGGKLKMADCSPMWAKISDK